MAELAIEKALRIVPQRFPDLSGPAIDRIDPVDPTGERLGPNVLAIYNPNRNGGKPFMTVGTYPSAAAAEAARVRQLRSVQPTGEEKIGGVTCWVYESWGPSVHTSVPLGGIWSR